MSFPKSSMHKARPDRETPSPAEPSPFDQVEAEIRDVLAHRDALLAKMLAVLPELGDCHAAWDPNILALRIDDLCFRLLPFDAQLQRLGLIVELPLNLSRDEEGTALAVLKCNGGLFAAMGCCAGADANNVVSLIFPMTEKYLEASSLAQTIRAARSTAQLVLMSWLPAAASP